MILLLERKRRLDVHVQAEQAKSAEAPFANVDGGSEATTACFSAGFCC